MARIYNKYCDMLDRYFTKKINESQQLRSYLLEPAQAFTIPAKDTRKRGLVIWLILKSDIHLSLRTLNEMINIVVSMIKGKLLLKGLVGVEIVPGFRMENGEIDRILRASIWAGKYKMWKEVNPRDMLKEELFEGVRCDWYWDGSILPVD